MSAELDLAGQIVELVRRAGGPEVQAEASVAHLDLALTRFANSAIHQNVAEATTRARLRLHVDGRTTAGSTTVLTPDGLRDLVDRTLAAARSAPRDPGWPGVAVPAAVPTYDVWDEATAQASPAERADRVRAFVAAAEGLTTAGYCRTAYRTGAVANTAGQSAAGRSTDAAMDCVARHDGAAGVARFGAIRLAELDGALLGGRAAAKARAGAAPVELPPREYEVVLESTAMADVLLNLAMFGFNGKAYQEHRSFVELGAAQFDAAITLVDDPTADPAWSFDAEGTPRRALPLVERGVSRAVAHDRRTAARLGVESTGHALEGRSVGGPMPINLRLLPAGPDSGTTTGGTTTGDTTGTTTGDATTGDTTGDALPDSPTGPIADADTAALVRGVRRGLLVTDLWYTRVLDPKSLVVTGLTRNGVWLIEDGEITAPVRDFRFTQSYPRALAPGTVLGIGRRLVRQPDHWGGAWWSAPPVRLAAWNFTGGASG